MGPGACPAPPVRPCRCAAGQRQGLRCPLRPQGGRRARAARTKAGALAPAFGLAGQGAKGPPAAKRRRPPQDLPGPTTALVYPCSFRPVSWIRPSLYRRGLPAAKAKRRHKSRLFPFASEWMIVGKGVPSDLVALIQGKSHEQRRRANGNGELHRVAQVQYHALSSHNAGAGETLAASNQ